jgi:hypothetical protein
MPSASGRNRLPSVTLLRISARRNSPQARRNSGQGTSRCVSTRCRDRFELALPPAGREFGDPWASTRARKTAHSSSSSARARNRDPAHTPRGHPIRLIQATDRAPAGGPLREGLPGPRCSDRRWPPRSAGSPRPSPGNRLDGARWHHPEIAKPSTPRQALDATTGPRRHDRPSTQCHAAMLARDANI